jgi:hypothetical protein
VLLEKKGSIYVADNDGDSEEARTFRPLQAAACTYRIAFGPRTGQKVLTVQGVMPRDTEFKQNLCADIGGFSLHAAVRCGADDMAQLGVLRRPLRGLEEREAEQPRASGQAGLTQANRPPRNPVRFTSRGRNVARQAGGVAR